MKNTKGATFIELMITVLIMGILVTVSIMLYSSYVRKGRRIDGINSLLSISLAEERYRANNILYGTLAQVWNGVTASSEGYYTLSISNVTASSYTVTATAVGNQANDVSNATSCTPLRLAVSNSVITKTPAVCWPI
jgi:type IV pilus assembly protein PilE